MTNNFQDNNFRRQFVNRLTFGLVKRIRIQERTHRAFTLSRRRRLSFRVRNQVSNLEANRKSENIGMTEHRNVNRLCQSDSVQQSADPREDIITAV